MMQIPHDFPPVPKCFSHLLNLHSFSSNIDYENEDQTLSQSLPTRHLELNSSTYTYARSLSENSQPPSSDITDYNSGTPVSTTTITGGGGGHLVFFQDVFLEDQHSNDVVIQNQTVKPNAPLTVIPSPNLVSPSTSTQRRVITKQSSFDLDDEQLDENEKSEQVQDLNNPFVKLNSSLEKLQKEMKELRLFDVNLFYHLLTLHESIQEVKLNNDRYSETGSECSLGSASYMGSMSSLDEESDWGESQVFFQSFRGEESTADDDDENRQSTSSLLEQIKALTQKAAEDI